MKKTFLITIVLISGAFAAETEIPFVGDIAISSHCILSIDVGPFFYTPMKNRDLQYHGLYFKPGVGIAGTYGKIGYALINTSGHAPVGFNVGAMAGYSWLDWGFIDKGKYIGLEAGVGIIILTVRVYVLHYFYSERTLPGLSFGFGW